MTEGTPQKTEEEIVIETVLYYCEHPRSVVGEPGTQVCMYRGGKDGSLRCAFSRCCVDDFVLVEGRRVDHHRLFGDNPLQYLRPEYQGHDVQFWGLVQRVHDFHIYWEGRHPTRALAAGVREYWGPPTLDRLQAAMDERWFTWAD